MVKEFRLCVEWIEPILFNLHRLHLYVIVVEVCVYLSKVFFFNTLFLFHPAIYSATSAVSHVVLGQFKTCILLLGNYFLFGSNPGTISICGAFTAIGGTSVYTYLNMKQQSNKVSPRQPSTLPKSKLGKENGSTNGNDGHYGAESV